MSVGGQKASYTDDDMTTPIKSGKQVKWIVVTFL